MQIINKLKSLMSGYSGGGASREKKVLQTWLPQHHSAKSDIELNLKLLRNRAADLVMNSPVGRAAVNTSTTGAIGAGLKLYPRIKYKELGLTTKQAREWSRRAKAEFELWSESVECDFYARNNFLELQQIAYSSYLMDGDCFCLFRRRAGKPYSLKLQLIEAGRVANPTQGAGLFENVEMTAQKRGNRIVNGVEVNAEGRMEAIWIANKVPGEIGLPESVEYKRVLMESSGVRNVLHICKDSRIGQYRGEPYLASVIETLKQVDRYGNAELASAVLKSFFSIFFTQGAQTFDINQIIGEDGEPCLSVEDYKVESGSILALPRGVDVKAIDNQSSQSTFADFTQQFLMQASAALGLPSETILKSYKSSYSASRAALLQAADEFRIRREAFIVDFCEPVYKQFLIEAIALGRIDAPGFFEDELIQKYWLGADWYVEGMHLLDVTKEMQGAEKRIELGISSRQREAAQLCGVDFTENLEQLREEQKLMQNLRKEGSMEAKE